MSIEIKNQSNTIDINNLKIDRCLLLNNMDKELKNKKNQFILKHTIEKEEEEFKECTFQPESKESIKRKFKEKLKTLNASQNKNNGSGKIKKLGNFSSSEINVNQKTKNKYCNSNTKNRKELEQDSLENQLSNQNEDICENSNKNTIISELRQITEEESIKKTISCIKPKRDVFNWDYFSKYVVTRRNNLNTIEEKQQKLSKIPGSGNIWKNQLTIPENIYLCTNKKTLEELNFNSLNGCNNETINFINSNRNLYTDQSILNTFIDHKGIKNVKDIANYYSHDAIRINSPIEYCSAVKFLHDELNKINFDLEEI